MASVSRGGMSCRRADAASNSLAYPVRIERTRRIKIFITGTRIAQSLQKESRNKFERERLLLDTNGHASILGGHGSVKLSSAFGNEKIELKRQMLGPNHRLERAFGKKTFKFPVFLVNLRVSVFC
jgi:hypothetical protein